MLGDFSVPDVGWTNASLIGSDNTFDTRLLVIVIEDLICNVLDHPFVTILNEF